MKTIFALLAPFVLCLPVFAQASTQPDLKTQFAAIQAQAPKGYPTPFVVRYAAISPGTILGSDGGCSMNLETLGQVYQVASPNGLLHDCKSFAPGTLVWGKVHRILGPVVDVLDPDSTKHKSKRYLVQNVVLVDTATQQ